MMKKTGFVKVIEEIVGAANQMEEFQNTDHYHIRIENQPFMPLVIEAWNVIDPLEVDQKRRISVAHYYKQNGDLIPDPEVEITETGWPIGFMNAFGFYQRITEKNEKGETIYKPRFKREVEAFLKMWGVNLKLQGFIERSKDMADKK